MGLKNEITGGLRYCTIIGGKFSIRTDADDPNGEPRQLKKGPNEGKTVYELKFNVLEGKINSLNLEDGEYGQRLCMAVVDDQGEQVMLQLGWGSNERASFVRCLPNIDFNQQVKFALSISKKGKTYLNLSQNGGKKVEPAYTRDEPNGMPEPIQSEKMGKVVWDWSDQEEFMYHLVKKYEEIVNQDLPAPTVEDATSDNVIDMANEVFNTTVAEECKQEEIPF